MRVGDQKVRTARAGRIWVHVCGRAEVLNYSCLGKMGVPLAVHRQDFETYVAKNSGLIL